MRKTLELSKEAVLEKNEVENLAISAKIFYGAIQQTRDIHTHKVRTEKLPLVCMRVER